jgi:amino acid permease
MIPILAAVAGVTALVLGVALGGTWRRAALLLLLGFGLGLALLAVAYFAATPSDQRQDCSDCYAYLGRWWEPGFAVFVIGLALISWVLGLLVGSCIHVSLRRRAIPRQAAE